MTVMTKVAASGDNILAAAEQLAMNGFSVHWVHPRAKNPVAGEWQNAPVANVEQLRASYRPGYNIGIRPGEPSLLVSGEYLLIFDVDVRVPELADEANAAFDRLFPGARAIMPIVASGSGGASWHGYATSPVAFFGRKLAHSETKHCRFDKAAGKDVESWDWEIDLFGTGRQVVAAPSIHPNGQKYRWSREFDFNLLAMGLGPSIPAEAIEAAGAASDGLAFELPPVEGMTIADADDILTRIPSAALDDRDDWLTIGMALSHEFGGSIEGFRLWMKHSARSTKHLVGSSERAELRRYRGFGKNRRAPVTISSVRRLAKIDVDMAMDEEPEPETAARDIFAAMLGDAPAASDPLGDFNTPPTPVPAWVARLNEKHAVAWVEGKLVVLSERPKGGMAYGSVADLHHFYANDRRPSGKSTTRPVSVFWMEHQKRRTYPNGIVFAPGGGRPGAYNSWTGFAVEPDPNGSCDRFLEHLRSNICSGSEDIFRWVIRWFAHMIQRPEEKPGTALVLKGAKGSGKDTVGDYVGSLFPPHHVKVSNPDHLVGRFNAHQERTLLLHVEEGFWAGNKQAEGSLKHVITSEIVLIEPKGVNAFQVDSVLRIFITSNEDWVVPATFDERRFCVLNVGSDVACDTGYFGALRHEMNNGGRAALLHHLQSLDLTGFDVRNPPMTEGLRDQKLQSLKNIDKWWYETLASGDVPPWTGSMSFDEGDPWEKSISVQRTSIRASYQAWMRDQRFEGRPLSEIEFGQRLSSLVPDLDTRRRRLADGSRSREYELPPRGACREAFSRSLGLRVTWN